MGFFKYLDLANAALQKKTRKPGSMRLPIRHATPDCVDGAGREQAGGTVHLPVRSPQEVPLQWRGVFSSRPPSGIGAEGRRNATPRKWNLSTRRFLRKEGAGLVAI